MSNHELDEALRRKLSVPIEPSANLWSKIEAALPPTNVVPLAKRKRRYAMPMGIAASIVVIIAIGAAILLQRNTPEYANTMAVQQPKQAHQNTPLPPSLQTIDSGMPTAQLPTTEQRQVPGAGRRQADPSSKSNVGSPIQDLDLTVQPAQSQLATLPQNNLMQNQIQVVPQKPILPTVERPNTLHDASSYAPKEMLQPATPTAATQAQEGLAMSVGGGYQYGNLNGGVAMNVNAHIPIGHNTFLEGTAGVVINNSTDNTLRYNGDFIASKAKANSPKAKPGRGNNGSVAAAAHNPYSTANGLYYLQLSPSIGVNVTKRIDISAGPDYQQMLNNSQSQDVVLFGKDNQSAVLPTNDFGVNAKIEYKISPSLKTGLQLRNGVNNLLRNENNYANRRYMQVQLKYILPTK